MNNHNTGGRVPLFFGNYKREKILKGVKYNYKNIELFASGGNSLIYRGETVEGVPVIIKEYYPQGLTGISRSPDGVSLVFSDPSDEPVFKELKDAAKKEDKLIKFQLTEKGKFNNYVDLSLDSFEIPNGTFYMVGLFANYRKLERQHSLPGALNTIERILEALEPVHNAGILHCDLSDSNILRTNIRARENAANTIIIHKIIDFGSAHFLSDIHDETKPLPNFTKTGEFTPHELKEDLKRDQIGIPSDLYSVGQILSWLINIEQNGGNTKRIKPDSPLAKGMNPQAIALTNELFDKTLASDPCDRYQTIVEMKTAVAKALKEAEKTIYLVNKTLEVTQDYIPRNDLEKGISDRLAKYSWANLVSMGGIGKSEAARAFAQNARHGKDSPYNTVHFAIYNCSLITTVANLEFANDTLQVTPAGLQECFNENLQECYAEKLKRLQDCDNSNLIIIDNFDTDIVIRDSDTFEEKRRKNTEMEVLELLHVMDAHVLFTTRHYWDSADRLRPEELEVGTLPFADLERLFIRNCRPVVPDPDFVKDCINLCISHTLAVIITARTASVSDDLPGLVNALRISFNKVNSEVRHDRNRRQAERTIYSHIKALYDFTSLSDGAKSLMSILCLVPPPGIDQYLFNAMTVADIEVDQEMINGFRTQLSDFRSLYEQGMITYDEIIFANNGLPPELVAEMFSPEGLSDERIAEYIKKFGKSKNEVETILVSQAKDIESLIRLGWITKADDLIHLHPITADMIFTELSPKLGPFETCDAFYNFVLLSIKNPDMNWDEKKAWVKIGKNIYNRYANKNDFIGDDILRIINIGAECLIYGQHGLIIPNEEIFEKKCIEAKPQFQVILKTVQNRNDAFETLSLNERLNELEQKIPFSIDVARIYKESAESCRRNGDYRQALLLGNIARYIMRYKDEAESSLPPHLHSLSNIEARKIGKDKNTERLTEFEALKEVLDSLNNLGYYQMVTECAEAVHEQPTALLSDSDNPLTTAYRFLLATNYINSGKIDKARAIIKKLPQHYHRHHTIEHIRSLICEKQGDIQGAERHLETAYNMCINAKNLSEKNEQNAYIAMLNMSRICAKAEKFDEALAYAERVKSFAVGSEFNEYFTNLLSLRFYEIYFGFGRYEEAEPLLLQIYERQRRDYLPLRPTTLTTDEYYRHDALMLRNLSHKTKDMPNFSSDDLPQIFTNNYSSLQTDRRYKNLEGFVKDSDFNLWCRQISLWLVCYRPHYENLLKVYVSFEKLYADAAMKKPDEAEKYRNLREKAVEEGKYIDEIMAQLPHSLVNLWIPCKEDCLLI